MTIESLQQKLEELGAPKCYYNLTGKGNDDERLNLVQVGDKWAVYFSERGVKTTYIEFDIMEDAIEYLYNDFLLTARLINEGKMKGW